MRQRIDENEVKVKENSVLSELLLESHYTNETLTQSELALR